MKKLLIVISLFLLAFAPLGSNPFVDVPVGSPGYAQIDQLYNDGYIAGRDATHFAPISHMTRAEIAVLIVRADHGPSFVPPAATGTLYPDVPASEWYAKWVEQATNDGYMGPKWGTNFNPNGNVTRSDVAALMGLALY